MKNLLIPTDFSINALHALNYALYLYKNEPCTFYILNAYQTSASFLESKRNKERNTRLFQSIKNNAENDLHELLRKIQNDHDNPKHTFKSLAVADTLVNAVGTTVLDHNIHFIFMGTQGASGLKSVFMGTNTVRIISKIDYCPIVAVPANYKFHIPDEILFVTGYEHLYHKRELNPMIAIAKLWNSKIRILHLIDDNSITQEKQAAKELIKIRLKGLPYEIMETTKTTKISNQIELIVTQNSEIGMVAIIDYWHSFLAKLTREPVVKNIAFQTKVPLMVMHLPH